MNRFHFSNEKWMVNVLRKKMGASFALNFELMLKEVHENKLSMGPYSLLKLSGVVWKLDKDKPLQYQIPSYIKGPVATLFEKMRKKTQLSIHLENLWFQGSVVLSNSGRDFYMNPIQALVALAMDKEMTRTQLIDRLGIPDDTTHNINGVLESLSKASLIRKCGDQVDTWYPNHEKDYPSVKIIMVPAVKNITPQQNQNHPEIHQVVVEAFIVRTLKREKTMKHNTLVNLVATTYKSYRVGDVKKIVEVLIDREFMEKNDDNCMCYVP